MANRTCCRCGTAFEPRNGNQRYCMKRCQKAGERERYRAKRVPMRCDHCGDEFMGRRWGSKNDGEHKRRYCSPECDAAARRKRLAGKRPTCVRPSRCPHDTNSVRTCPACTFVDRALSVRVSMRRVVRQDPCGYCGATEGGLDHITPTAAGGLDDWSNWTGSCHRCNSIKGTHPLLLALLWLPTCRGYHDMKAILYPGGHPQPLVD